MVVGVVGPAWTQVRDEKEQRRIDKWNDFVALELTAAWDLGKQIIPILVPNTPQDVFSSDLREPLGQLAELQWLEVSGRYWSQSIEALLAAVRSGLERG